MDGTYHRDYCACDEDFGGEVDVRGNGAKKGLDRLDERERNMHIFRVALL